MNNRLYSHLYLDLKYIFILKKRSTFANFLMEEPVNSIAIAKIGKIASLLKNLLWDSFHSSC